MPHEEMQTQFVGLRLPLRQRRSSGLLLNALFLHRRADLHFALLLDPVLVRLDLLGKVVQHVFRLFLPTLHLQHFYLYFFNLLHWLHWLDFLN